MFSFHFSLLSVTLRGVKHCCINWNHLPIAWSCGPLLNRSEEKSSKYSEFLADYTDVPKASVSLIQLLIKYDQQATVAAFFFYRVKRKGRSLIFLRVLSVQFQIRSTPRSRSINGKVL